LKNKIKGRGGGGERCRRENVGKAVEILNKLLGTRMMPAQQPPIYLFIHSFILALLTYTLFDWFQQERASFF
jgi:hypothetical protein